MHHTCLRAHLYKHTCMQAQTRGVLRNAHGYSHICACMDTSTHPPLAQGSTIGLWQSQRKKRQMKDQELSPLLKWQGLSCGPSLPRGWVAVCRQSRSLRHMYEHRLEPRQTQSHLSHYALFSSNMDMPCRHSSLLLILYLHTALRINLFHFPNNAYSLLFTAGTLGCFESGL